MVARDWAVGVVAEDFAAQVRGILGGRSDVILAEGDVELAVRPEGEPPTLMAAVPAGREVVDDGGQAGARPALVQPAHDALPSGVVRTAIEGVDEVVPGKRRGQGEAQKPPLAVG